MTVMIHEKVGLEDSTGKYLAIHDTRRLYRATNTRTVDHVVEEAESAETRLEGVSGEFCEPLCASQGTCVCVKMRVLACHVALKARSQGAEATRGHCSSLASASRLAGYCLRERIVVGGG